VARDDNVGNAEEDDPDGLDEVSQSVSEAPAEV